jgi:hypothetical protein
MLMVMLKMMLMMKNDKDEVVYDLLFDCLFALAHDVGPSWPGGYVDR